MLNGAQLAVAITSVLVGAVAVGWLLHLAWGWLTGAGGTDQGRLATLLHEADEARARAEAAAAQATALLARREAEMATELAALQSRLDGDLSRREAELLRDLREARAEAQALSEGLGTARRHIADLQSRVGP